MNAAARFAPIVILAAIWEMAPRAGLVNAEFLPPLSAIGGAWVRQLWSGELTYNASVSLANCVSGLALGVIVGSILGIMMAWSPILDAAIGPLVRMTYPIPRSALVPVMILWVGLGSTSKIAAIFSGCLLPIVVSAYNGARGVDRSLIWSARALGATESEILREVLFPGALADILAGARSAIAIAFVLMVTSEFLVGGRGLGYLISFLGDAGAYPEMFGDVLTVAAIGFLADRAYQKYMTFALRWRQ